MMWMGHSFGPFAPPGKNLMRICAGFLNPDMIDRIVQKYVKGALGHT